MIRKLIHRLLFWLTILPWLFIMVVCLQRDSFLPDTLLDRARLMAANEEFEFFGWTIDALWFKAAQASLDQDRYLSEADWHAEILSYNSLLEGIHRKEDELKRIFADPAFADPMKETEILRAELARDRAEQTGRQPLVEAILQKQIAAEIRSEGFNLGGQVFPPILFHFTPIPNMLILSPRDAIRQEAAVQLLPDLTLEQQIALEQESEARFGVSALVVPLGGLGTYPTMIMESTWIPWVAEAIAHEWTHNYLTLRPLGMGYDSSSALRTINETAASIAGKKISARVISRFYPELAPPPPPADPPAAVEENPLPPIAPPVFDFNTEMHVTRVEVDRLLAEGNVAEAEAYMDSRRKVFIENGYMIRRLNQAYFAFYGAYADTPGERGEDPIGPLVEQLFLQCPSLGAFLRSIGGVTNLAGLQLLMEQPGSCR